MEWYKRVGRIGRVFIVLGCLQKTPQIDCGNHRKRFSFKSHVIVFSLAKHRKLQCCLEAYQKHPMLVWGSYFVFPSVDLSTGFLLNFLKTRQMNTPPQISPGPASWFPRPSQPGSPSQRSDGREAQDPKLKILKVKILS